MFFKDGCFRVYFLEVKKQKRGNPREEGPRVIPSQQCRTADLQLPGRFTTAQSRSLVKQLMRLPAEMTLDEAARTVRTGGFGFRVSFPFVFITLHTTQGRKEKDRQRTHVFFHSAMKKLPFVTMFTGKAY